MAHSIVFSNETTRLEGDSDKDMDTDRQYNMNIYAKRKNIIVESNLRETAEVRITNAAGITVATFNIEPGETVKTRVDSEGIYIVYADNGRYITKLGVK